MSKIHLEIEIPGNAKTYEFVLDDRMKIGTAKEQIKKQIAELEGHGHLLLRGRKRQGIYGRSDIYHNDWQELMYRMLVQFHMVVMV